jgi:Rieske Fe-S protein
MTDSQRDRDATRRTVLGATAGGAAAATLLTACGSASSPAPPATPAAASTAAPASSSPGSATASTPAGAVLAQAADVPVGGGILVSDQKVVVTQPTAGTFAAVSAVCTHRSCLVQAPANGVIVCACHGSEYGLDGSVKKGPATQPLPAVPVVAADGAIRKG